MDDEGECDDKRDRPVWRCSDRVSEGQERGRRFAKQSLQDHAGAGAG